MENAPEARIQPEHPYATITRNEDGAWVYRWWDTGTAYVIGEPPTRLKRYLALGGILAALLSDAARTGHGDMQSTAWEH